MTSRRPWNFLLIGFIGMGFAAAVCGQDAQQQNDGQQGPRRGDRGDRRGDRGDRRGDRGSRGDRGGFPGDRGGPGDRFGRGGPGRSAPTPEERDRFYDEMARRYLERLTETYELDEQQQVQVQSRLEELKAEQKATSEARRQQFDSLHTEMHRLRDSGRQGNEADAQRAREIGQQMRSLWESAPLMNREKVISDVEKLLPAEQVEKGRARHAQEDAERRQRFEEMRRQWEERRQQRDAQSPPDGEGPPDDWRQRRWSRDNQDEQGQPEAQPLDAQVFRVDGPPAPLPLVEDPIGPWDRYVRDFGRRYRLDQSQQATAQSVLREMHERRVAYEQTHRSDYEAARQIEDDGEQEKRLAQLNKPVEGLFSQLKIRLDRIPTAEQRRLAGDRPTSRSTVTTTQPAASTTQPAGK